MAPQLPAISLKRPGKKKKETHCGPTKQFFLTLDRRVYCPTHILPSLDLSSPSSLLSNLLGLPSFAFFALISFLFFLELLASVYMHSVPFYKALFALQMVNISLECREVMVYDEYGIFGLPKMLFMRLPLYVSTHVCCFLFCSLF